MKLLRRSLALVVLGSLSIVAFSQTEAPKQEEAFKTLQQDLNSAIEAMKPCLPIYAGHCGQARNEVHKAQSLIKGILVGNAATAKVVAKESTPPAKAPEKKIEKKAEATKPINAPKPAEKPAEKAPVVDKPKPKPPTEEEIAASQATFQKALEAIQKAIKDLSATKASLPETEATKLEQLLQAAEAEANKGLAIHAKKG